MCGKYRTIGNQAQAEILPYVGYHGGTMASPTSQNVLQKKFIRGNAGIASKNVLRIDLK
jgi:hypothetical protein